MNKFITEYFLNGKDKKYYIDDLVVAREIDKSNAIIGRIEQITNKGLYIRPVDTEKSKYINLNNLKSIYGLEKASDIIELELRCFTLSGGER